MKPGRDLDAAIAEHVMGWNNVHREGDWGFFGRPFGETRDSSVPEYSTDISAAEEVWDKLIDEGWLGFELVSTDQGIIKLTIFEHYPLDKNKEFISVEGETKAHVICLAALKVVGVEI